MFDEIELPAFKYEQNGTMMFLFLAKAALIYEKFAVSRRIDDKEFGYQRSFSSTRIRQIKNYLLQEKGIIPNSILVNIDDGKYRYDESNNSLVLKDENAIGFIIDGQHLIKRGLRSTTRLATPRCSHRCFKNKNTSSTFCEN